MNNLEVLYEDDHIIVVVKPNNVLSQSDNTNDIDMLTIIKKYLKKNSYSFNDKQIELLTEFKFSENIKSKRLLIAKYEASLCLKKI